MMGGSIALRLMSAMVLMAATGAAHADGDAARGEKRFEECAACHKTEPGVNNVGPSLHGVFERKAGELPDYRYSPALQKSGIVWNDETLDKWLADPQALVPGTKMFFDVKSPQDRADVIEFLKEKGGVAN